MFKAMAPLQRWLLARLALAQRLNARDDPTAELPASIAAQYLGQQVLLAGCGWVGGALARRWPRMAAVPDDAAEPDVLVQAHVAQARLMVAATPDTLNVRQMIGVARALNPGIEIVLRTHNEAEAALLRREAAGEVFLGEHELADAVARHLLARTAAASAH